MAVHSPLMQQTTHNLAMSSRDGLGDHLVGMSVKNTFINFYVEDPVLDDVPNMQLARQLSEPTLRIQRHSSVMVEAREPFQSARVDADSAPLENWKSESEPEQPQFAQHDWSSSSAPGVAAIQSPVYAAPTLIWVGLDASGHAAAAQPHADTIVVSQMPDCWDGTTTVMMRNLPNKYTQFMLVTELNNTGFAGLFDFFYLPIDPETNANRGYAFINFIDAEHAWRFKTVYEGRKLPRFNSTKHVSVTPATLQGFEANFNHYSDARVNRGDHAARPLFLRSPGDAIQGHGGSRQHRRGQHSRSGGTGSDRTTAATSAKSVAHSAARVPNTRSTKRLNHPISAIAAAPRISGESAVGTGMWFCPVCGGDAASKSCSCQFCGSAMEAYAGPPQGIEADPFNNGTFAPADVPNMWFAGVHGA